MSALRWTSTTTKDNNITDNERAFEIFILVES